MSQERREVTIVVDGREIAAIEGEMLHDACRKGDVEIPVFCYEPKLGQPVGACRMCLVEIEGMPKLQTSCSTPVRDGMVVHTRNEQVKGAQNAVVEFLLVNHPLDCPVCDKGGECPLQDISMGWGPGKSRVTDPKRHFEKPIPLSPLVALDRERCILCYRCVRFSQEISEDAQLQLLERGDRTYVGTFDDRSYVAPFHGNITDLCPVGALTNYTYRFRARPWDIEQAGSVCTLCPSQCNVGFTVRDEQVKRVVARENPEVDDGWLCDRGRYGFAMFQSEERVTAPRLREMGGMSWEETIAAAAAGLHAAGAASAAIVGDASNEEGFLLQRLMREALGSPHVDSRASSGASRATLLRLARPELSARVRDIDAAEAILLVGTDPVHSSSILDLRIRKVLRRNGAKLAVATERPTTLDGGAEAVTVVWGERIGREGEAALQALLDVAAALGLAGKERSGLLEVPEAANARGLREVGCLPDAGPGFAATDAGMGTEEIRAALEAGELNAIVLYGVDPLRDFPDTAAWRRALDAAKLVIAFSQFENATTRKAHVVLPLENHAEKNGTVTHPDGRLQRVRPSAARPGEVRAGWRVLTELCAALGHETGIDSQPEALATVAEAVPFYAGIDDSVIGGRGVRWQEREAVSALPGPGEAAAGSAEALPPPAEADNGSFRLGTYRDLWAGPITELNPPLRFLQPRQRVELSAADAERLGLQGGDEVAVRRNGSSVKARVVVRERIADGTCFLVEGTEDGNANALLNGGPAAVTIEKAAG